MCDFIALDERGKEASGLLNIGLMEKKKNKNKKVTNTSSSHVFS